MAAHRIEITRVYHYGCLLNYLWECDCSRQGIAQPDEDLRLAATAHVAGGATVIFAALAKETAEELDG